jgi:hypothetical protein
MWQFYNNYFALRRYSEFIKTIKTKLNSVAFSPQANYTDQEAAACRRS